jgi:uncharacterized protein (TIGR03435 family)
LRISAIFSGQLHPQPEQGLVHELKWEGKDQEHPDLATLAKAVREQLGLELTPAKRAVEVLVVDDAKSESDMRQVPARRAP